MRKISTIIDGKRVITKKPELLAPAGDLQKLKFAFMYGADACFIGGKEFSLRARASNFDTKDIKEAVDFANSLNKKVYVTTNIICHNENLDGLEDYLHSLESVGVHGIICADPYIIETAKKVTPNLELHISTQQSITNYEAVNFWYDEGIERVVLARELTAKEIKTVCENTECQIEVFIHGGMCVSYSGRCTLSNNMTDRDANRGGCAHSCRWNYDLYKQSDNEVNKKNPDEISFAMSSKDLMTLEYIPDLIEYGVDSLKIEGRMKSLHYIATVVSTYRRLIDDYCADPDHFIFDKDYVNQIKKAENRLTAEGFLGGMTTIKHQLYNMRSEQPTKEFVGLVLEYDESTEIVKIEQRNYFTIGDTLELLSFNGQISEFKIEKMSDEDGNELDVARHPRQIIYFKSSIKMEKDNIIRKVINNEQVAK